MTAERRRSELPYTLRRALDSITAAPVVTGVTLTALIVSVLFAGAIVLTSSNAQRLVSQWASAGLDASLYLAPNTADADIVKLRTILEADPLLAHVEFVSSDEAWQYLAEALENGPELLSGVDPSVLPASFEVTLEPWIERDELDGRLAKWRASPAVTDVQYDRFDTGRRSGALGLVGWLAWALGALALVASALLVGSAFQLAAYSRRDELDVLRLMGASGSIYWSPIFLAGLLEGVVASLVALAALGAAFSFVHVAMQAELPMLASSVVFFSKGQLAMLAGWGGLLGAAGSLLGTWRIVQWR